MIAFTSVDYAIIVAACTVVLVRTFVDFREVVAARTATKTMKAITRRSFSPALAVIVPLRSLDNTKKLIQQLQLSDLNITTIVVVDSSLYSSAAAKLRYFITKNTIAKTVVVASKSPQLTAIAKKHAAAGLVVALPDTAELSGSFYFDAILPFGDASVDVVRLVPGVRPGKTLSSGLEALAAAWRNYFGMPGGSQNETTLQEGVIWRAKHVRRLPKRKLNEVDIHKLVYSVSAQNVPRSAWRKLQNSMSVTDWVTALVAAGAAGLLLQPHGSTFFVIGAFILLYELLVWWAAGMARASITNRVSMMLLAPVFILMIWCLLIANTVRVFSPKRFRRIVNVNSLKELQLAIWNH